MANTEYRELLKSIRPNRKLGQCFLTNRDIAKSEANFGIGKNVVEMGPGLGILTKELCSSAKSVLAIEKDTRLYDILNSTVKSRKLTLLNKDFFSVPKTKFKPINIMISNVPYVLSSKTVFWLARMNMPAVLCLQKEFVAHMLSNPGTDSYSRLSVMCGLHFTLTKIFDVPRGNFYPMPNVDSTLVHIKPKGIKISKDVEEIITGLMAHKKKKVRNAIIDSVKTLKKDHSKIAAMADSIKNSDKRPFQLKPEDLLEIATEIEEH